MARQFFIIPIGACLITNKRLGRLVCLLRISLGGILFFYQSLVFFSVPQGIFYYRLIFFSFSSTNDTPRGSNTQSLLSLYTRIYKTRFKANIHLLFFSSQRLQGVRSSMRKSGHSNTKVFTARPIPPPSAPLRGTRQRPRAATHSLQSSSGPRPRSCPSTSQPRACRACRPVRTP